MWRKTIMVTAIAGAGLISTTGAAFAGDASCDDNNSGNDHGHHHSWDHGQSWNKDGCTNAIDAHNGDHQPPGLIDASNIQTIAPINICGNHVNVDALSDLGGLTGGLTGGGSGGSGGLIP